jgi:hypothetical protein
MKLFHFLMLLLCLLSCGEKEDEKTDDLVRSANFLLNTRNCQEAINLLENYGRRPTNTRYIQTLASAYACRAGFDEPSFYQSLTDISSDTGGFIGSLTVLSSSVMTSSIDSAYVDIWRAIDILLPAPGYNEIGSDFRSNVFISNDANDINIQLLYLLLTQLGKYAFFYGNANPTIGTKGEGTVVNGNPNANTNECFTTYTATSALAIINNVATPTAPCDDLDGAGGDDDDGHPQLTKPGISHELFVTRMCEGVVLFNNVVDVFGAVALSTSANFSTVTTLQGNIDDVFNTACGLLGGNNLICSVKSQSVCETEFGEEQADPSLNVGSNLLEIYFAAIYEQLFTN